MFERVDFEDGDKFELVTLPMSRHALALAVRNEFRQELEGARCWLPEMDASLFRYLGGYYRKLASFCEPSFDPIYLKPISRHKFFVCTEPIDLPSVATGVPGLAGIDRLLGLAYPEVKPVDKLKPPIATVTSGDPVRDLFADLLLVFKSDARWLTENYSVEYLSKLVLQATQRQDPELLQRLQQDADRKFFDEQRLDEALRAHYAKQGIPIPEDF